MNVLEGKHPQNQFLWERGRSNKQTTRQLLYETCLCQKMISERLFNVQTELAIEAIEVGCLLDLVLLFL